MSKGNGNNAATVSLCAHGLRVPCWPGFPSLPVSHTLQVRPLGVGNQQPGVGREGWRYIDVKIQSVISNWVSYTGWTVRMKWSSSDFKSWNSVDNHVCYKNMLYILFWVMYTFCRCYTVYCIKGKSTLKLNLHFCCFSDFESKVSIYNLEQGASVIYCL